MKRSEKLSRPRHDRAGRIAPAGSRSCKPHLAKVSPSAPVPLAASVPKSERTIAREAPCIFFFNDTATTEIYTLSLHDALPTSTIVAASPGPPISFRRSDGPLPRGGTRPRSEEHTSELQSRFDIVCRLLLE